MAKNLTRRSFMAATGAAVAVSAIGAAGAAEMQEGVKILGIACSYRKNKTTATALRTALEAAREVSPKVEVELIELGGMRIDGGIAAGNGGQDDFGQVQAKLAEPKVGGIIVGTPIYFGNMSSLCKAFFERCMAVRQNWLLRNKVGGALAVGAARNGGQEFALHSIHACLFAQDMIVVGDGRPFAHMGATLWNNAKDDIAQDQWGMTIAKNLGRRVAEVALKMAGR